jgi:hypothetical protein
MVLKHLSVADILRLFPRGTKIPKPESSEARIKGIGSRRGQTAIVYTMPSHSDSSRPHVKGVTEGEIHASRLQLHATGEFSRSWFNEHLRACKQEGRCNFTTLGGLMVLLGEATYHRGCYTREVGGTSSMNRDAHT